MRVGRRDHARGGRSILERHHVQRGDSFPYPNRDLVYDSRSSSVYLNGDDRGVDLYFEDQVTGSYRDFYFTPPAGQRLQTGKTYLGAQRHPFQDEGRPGLDVTGDARGCNKVQGAFRIEDLATTPDGKVTRLRAVFEHHCGNVPPATFGEVRYGYPEPPGPVTMPSVLRWPPQERGATAVPRPVTVRGGGGSANLTSTTIAGPGAGAFSVTRDECAGKPLAPTATCRVWVAYDPAAPGSAVAQLRIGRSTGAPLTTDLIGNAYGGVTKLDIDQPADSGWGGGMDIRYTSANGIFYAERAQTYGTEADPRYIQSVAVSGDDGNLPVLRFYLPDHEQMVVGRTYRVTEDRPNPDGGAFIELLAYNGACNAIRGWFRFDEMRMDAYGDPAAVDVSFDYDCWRGKAIPLTGRFRRRAGDTTPAPAWVAGSITDPVVPGGHPPATGPKPGAAAPATRPSRRPTVPPSPLVPSTAPTDLAIDLTPQERRTCRRYQGRLPKVTSGLDSRDRIRGTRKRDAIAAGGGRDRVAAGNGADCVSGGTGGDRIDGGDGRDVLMGSLGDDTLIGGPGKDVLLCGPGRDTVVAGPGDRWGGCERVVRVRR